MRYALLLLFIISLTFSSNQLISKASLDSIKVMSYNIRLDHSGDNENNWHHRKADMIEYLNYESCDFIGIQEALFHQLQYLDQGMVEYDYLGVGREDGREGGEFAAILFRKSWKVLDKGNFWLSPSPKEASKGWDAACIRICSWGKFENENGDDLLILNTHFDHVGQEARSKSIELILDFISENENDLPVIFMGDLNFSPDDPLYQLISDKMNDAFSSSFFPKDNFPGTFNAFSSEGPFTKRIDYIFINDKFERLDFRIDQPKTQHSLQLSDHFPVITQLKF